MGRIVLVEVRFYNNTYPDGYYSRLGWSDMRTYHIELHVASNVDQSEALASLQEYLGHGSRVIKTGDEAGTDNVYITIVDEQEGAPEDEVILTTVQRWFAMTGLATYARLGYGQPS